MSIGVIILSIACVYLFVFAVILGLRKNPHTGTEKKQKDEIRNFIIDAFGVALLFVAFMMIIPTPRPGTDRWLNSVSFLRYFWKTLGSLFVAVASFGVTTLIGMGIGSLFIIGQLGTVRFCPFCLLQM